MTKTDWKDYASYLQSQLKGKSLKHPSSIEEAYNNYVLVQDLEDVNTRIHAKR